MEERAFSRGRAGQDIRRFISWTNGELLSVGTRSRAASINLSRKVRSHGRNGIDSGRKSGDFYIRGNFRTGGFIIVDYDAVRVLSLSLDHSFSSILLLCAYARRNFDRASPPRRLSPYSIRHLNGESRLFYDFSAFIASRLSWTLKFSLTVFMRLFFDH